MLIALYVLTVLCYDFAETPYPPDIVYANATEDGIVISIDNNIQDSQWELSHYLITAYDKTSNVLSHHKFIDTPILIPEHAGINFFEVVTVTLCHQESSSKIVPYEHSNNINGGALRNINFFSWHVMVAFALSLVNYNVM